MTSIERSTSADILSISTKKHSCILCQQRKVKCDKGQPCSGCRKAQVLCEYRNPQPTKRRPRKAAVLGLHARVARYEQLLIKFGINIEDAIAEDPDLLANKGGSAADSIGPRNQFHGVSPCRVPSMSSDGEETITAHAQSPSGNGDSVHEARENMVLPEEGSTQLTNGNLWRPVDQGLHHLNSDVTNQDYTQNQDLHLPSRSNLDIASKCSPPDDAQFLFDPEIGDVLDATAYHPEPTITRRLWNVFRDNVDPLVKLFHAPTTEKLLFENIDPARMGQVPANVNALLFSIYHLAVISMSAEDTLASIGEPKDLLSRRYRKCCQAALTRACLLRTSDIITLQAFTLYLLGERLICDAASMWVLSGIAVRIGQRMGLHKETGSAHLSPFQREMRRRLWWQIVVLDRTSSEVTNIGAANVDWDTKLPANLDDRDLNQDMQELPKDREGATEMMFVRMRYELGQFFKTLKCGEHARNEYDASWTRLKHPSVSLVEKDRALAEITSHFEVRYLRYCDPTVPLHYLVSVTARSILCMLYLATRQPWDLSGKREDMSQEERDNTYEKALKVIEYGNVLQRSQATKCFLWRENAFFIWHPFIFVLHYLAHASTNLPMDKAWEHVEQVYKDRPTLLSERKNDLHAAVRKLTVKAWDHREKILEEQGRMPMRDPDFIRILKQTATSDVNPTSNEHTDVLLDSPQPQNVSPMAAATAAQGPFGVETSTDWVLWDNLVGSLYPQTFDGGAMCDLDFMAC
ncbi:hypothetical protein EJ04DRAFT_580956 [Polyplosphaeria fusca]|uniref:Zn(2)-C6 fungal-type domain-containing protein n=1 Tax=Polyplosphaeria fusca TaxID=682080 RepID=A0A9P4QQB1_9PLEO|nr:hypothetical protein EJ04DRAFT_580956 [Polyplosphaeria fusca]